VIHTHFWEAIEALLKLVEFRSPRQSIPFFPGLRLLFSLNAAERRTGRHELLAADVLEIVSLSRARAYTRFPREAEACNLTGLCNKWGCTTVQCLVLDANSIAVARDIVHLSLGNQGILRQINDTDGTARFCHRDQLGTTEMVRLSTGKAVYCTYARTWPDCPEAHADAASFARLGSGGGVVPRDRRADSAQYSGNETMLEGPTASQEGRRRPFHWNYPPQASGSLTPARGAIQHMTDVVVTTFKPVFEAMGLSSQPGALQDVSYRHFQALANVMDTLHEALPQAIDPQKEMPVPLASIATMRPGRRPDDECVDYMARAAAEATGSYMPGKPGKPESQDWDAREPSAGSLRVMGPLHTEDFRRMVRKPTHKRKAVEIDHDPEILAAEDGPPESRDDALKRLHRLVMGPASGMDSAVFPSKLLLLSTHNVHTTLVELCREQTANMPPCWSICVHDSLECEPRKVDPLLNTGLSDYLIEYGGKTGHFRFVKQPQRIKQEDDIVCSLMAICRLILKLTGEELLDIYWTPCVQIIRTFSLT